LSRVESDSDINSSINNPYEEMLKEKMPGTKLVIDMKSSSIDKPSERFEKEKKEEGEIVKGSIVKEESLITPLTNIIDKESSKGNCNIFNSSFHSYFILIFCSKNIENITMFCCYLPQSNDKNIVKKNMFIKQ